MCSDAHVAESDCSDLGAGLWRFKNITLNGEWTDTDKDVLRLEIAAEAVALSIACGNHCLNMTPVEIFKAVYGNRTVNLLDDGLGKGCAAINGGTECSEGTANTLDDASTAGLMLHEDGHAFDHSINGIWGYARTELGKATIKTSTGKYVEGLKDGIWSRKNDGYRCNTYPYQQHPLSSVNGNTPGEDLADMYRSWVIDVTGIYDSNGFANNAAGQGRFNWMNEHMEIWVPLVVKQ